MLGRLILDTLRGKKSSDSLIAMSRISECGSVSNQRHDQKFKLNTSVEKDVLHYNT